MICSFSCTREPTYPTKYAGNLAKQRVSNTHDFLIQEDSIFEAYSNAIKACEGKGLTKEDVVIFCHDDIEVWDDPKLFKQNLLDTLDKKNTGFVGVAGTTVLTEDCIWWEINRRQAGLHRGFVFQGSGRDNYTPNYFGPNGDVCVLDGVFLACKFGTFQTIFPDGFKKPANFEGNWDFYDLFMTIEAHRKGFINRTFPGVILHKSPGEIAGRDSWQKNRVAFQKNYSGGFPFCS